MHTSKYRFHARETGPSNRNRSCSWLDQAPKGIVQDRRCNWQLRSNDGVWNKNQLDWSTKIRERPPGATWLRRG